jgi:hypothetical protein
LVFCAGLISAFPAVVLGVSFVSPLKQSITATMMLAALFPIGTDRQFCGSTPFHQPRRRNISGRQSWRC